MAAQVILDSRDNDVLNIQRNSMPFFSLQSAYQQTHNEIFDIFILAHNGLVTPAEPASAQQGHQPSDRS